MVKINVDKEQYVIAGYQISRIRTNIMSRHGQIVIWLKGILLSKAMKVEVI